MSGSNGYPGTTRARGALVERKHDDQSRREVGR